MAENFLAFDREIKAQVYFGEFGEVHTILKNRDLASIINASPPFMGKVAVIDLYCYDCSTPAEAVSNWPLNGMERIFFAISCRYVRGILLYSIFRIQTRLWRPTGLMGSF